MRLARDGMLKGNSRESTITNRSGFGSVEQLEREVRCDLGKGTTLRTRVSVTLLNYKERVWRE
jgi:hypothetical protein